MDYSEVNTEAAVVADLTRKAYAGEIQLIDGGTPYAVVPDGAELHSLEGFLPQPMRRTASVTFESVASFCEYVGLYGERPRLFAQPASSSIVAYLDYHEAGVDGEASWCTHQAKLQLKLSKSWSAWAGADGRSFNQIAFAEFLEDNLLDIVEPDGAVVLEVAKHLEAKKTVAFKSGVNMNNGAVQFLYDENIDGKGKGSVTVPTVFVLGIPVYEHGEPYRVNVRLRYRLADDRLTFLYKIDRPDRILETAFNDVLAWVQEASGIKPFIGCVTGLPSRIG